MLDLNELFEKLNTVISVLSPVIFAFIGGWISHFFLLKKTNRSFIIDNTYEIHRKFFFTLDNFFNDRFDILNDIDGFISKNKEKKKKSNEYLNNSYQDFCEKVEDDDWYGAVQMYSIVDPIKLFDEWADDINELRALSNSKIRKLADKIYTKYRYTKMEEKDFEDRLREGLEYEDPRMVSKYCSVLKHHYLYLFWAENIKDLVKLRKYLKKFIALK